MSVAEAGVAEHSASSDSDDSDAEDEKDSAPEQIIEQGSPEPEVPKRPKKRRKEEKDDESQDVEMKEAESPADLTEPATRRSPSPLAALPSFPLPALPNAPPKSVLALQGLDQALVDAEIVDPSTLLPIPSDGEDDAGTGLSEKTRKRLQELGIVELFAGSEDQQLLHPQLTVTSPNGSTSFPAPQKSIPKVSVSAIRPSERCLCIRPHGERQNSRLCSAYHRSRCMLFYWNQTRVMEKNIASILADSDSSSRASGVTYTRFGHASARNIRSHRQRPWLEGIQSYFYCTSHDLDAANFR